MMMPVHRDKGLLGHAEEARRFPRRHAALCEPRRTGVAQGVRRHVSKSSRADD